jgi:enoyl-CoA hydratase
MEGVIGCELVDGLAEVTIHIPPVNALSIADAWALRDLFRTVAASSDAGVVLLRAEGRGFGAGIDFKQMQSPRAQELLLESGRACRAAFAAITSCPLPVVVAVQGFCMGAAAAIVASCDLVVAAADAHFALPEGAWSIAYLSRLVPPMKLRQTALTGERLTAEELRQCGSVYRVVEPGAVLDEARAVAKGLTGQRREALIATKAKLNAIEQYDLDRMFWEEQAFVYASAWPGRTGELL